MELPVVNRVNDFEVTLNSLSNPSFISRFLANIFEFGNLTQPYRFWKWGALFLAFLYTFSNVIRRIKFLVFKHRTPNINPSQSLSDPLLSDYDSDFYSEDDQDDDDDDEEVCSSSYSSDNENEESTSSCCDNLTGRFEDFRVADGSRQSGEGRGLQNRKYKLCRRRSIGDIFSLSELVNGKGIVKLWDGLGIKVDLDGSSINCGLDSFFAPTPVVSFSSSPPSSPSYLVSAETTDGRLGFNVWDTRIKKGTPAIKAEWKPQRRKEATLTGGVNDVGGEVGKVFVRNEMSRELTVGDVRRVGSPLGTVMEYDEDDASTWWDADAVVVAPEPLQG